MIKSCDTPVNSPGLGTPGTVRNFVVRRPVPSSQFPTALVSVVIYHRQGAYLYLPRVYRPSNMLCTKPIRRALPGLPARSYLGATELPIPYVYKRIGL